MVVRSDNEIEQLFAAQRERMLAEGWEERGEYGELISPPGVEQFVLDPSLRHGRKRLVRLPKGWVKRGWRLHSHRGSIPGFILPRDHETRS